MDVKLWAFYSWKDHGTSEFMWISKYCEFVGLLKKKLSCRYDQVNNLRMYRLSWSIKVSNVVIVIFNFICCLDIPSGPWTPPCNIRLSWPVVQWDSLRMQSYSDPAVPGATRKTSRTNQWCSRTARDMLSYSQEVTESRGWPSQVLSLALSSWLHNDISKKGD